MIIGYGAELSRVYFDEFQRQSEYCFDVIRSRLRSKAKVKSCARMTLNPDGGHFVYDWVKPFLNEEGYPDKELACKIRYFVMVGGVLHSDWDREELKKKFPDKNAKTYTLIPSTIEDNKILQDLEIDYKSSLDSLPEAKRKQLLLGCWHNTETGCMYFNREWLSPVDKLPANASRCRAWDLAGTEYDPSSPSGSYARNPDYTAGVLMSKSQESSLDKTWQYVVEDVVRERFSAAKVEDLIIKTAYEDKEQYGDSVVIYLPTDPNPASQRYIKGFISELTSLGFRATTTKTNKAKVDRFQPFSIAAETGLVKYVRADWNKDYFGELENFTGIPKDMRRSKDDMLDATSDAFSVLNSNKVIRAYSLPDTTSPTAYTSYRKSIR
ncbi:terminase large subunit [Pseudoalteromonas phage J2-1]|uniref:Terminase large subunit n=1 Tax=Pseudoalteromonas phage J2-1 TaxID=2023998 RepID=A0A223LHC5_9CAUD|nr:terminase large subunit [Pseudoalteromonas phage J2-1]ASU03382.1 terminase large subunit [Pseudoalteromonas phage J2-1]